MRVVDDDDDDQSCQQILVASQKKKNHVGPIHIEPVRKLIVTISVSAPPSSH